VNKEACFGFFLFFQFFIPSDAQTPISWIATLMQSSPFITTKQTSAPLPVVLISYIMVNGIVNVSVKKMDMRIVK
jgi:hypothetical protein